MKKQADTTTDMNREQALVDFVVGPNSYDDEDITASDAERAADEPTPQSKPTPQALLGTTVPGRGTTAPVPPGHKQVAPESTPGFSQVAPGQSGKEIDMPTPADKAEEATTNKVKKYQELFTSMGLWDKEINGEITHNLINIGRDIERQISNKIGNKSIIGMIVAEDGSTFNAEADDVSNAIQLIEYHQKAEKGIKYSMDDRVISLSRIIHK